MARIVPITLDQYSNKRWVRYSNFKFAATDMVCAITAHEILRAVLSTPIGFIRQDGKYVLVALQGLQKDSNLCVSKEGVWLGRYIPQRYACYPFRAVQNAEGSQILCIDEDSGLITEDNIENSEVFFDENGNPSKLMTDFVKFLGGYEVRLKATAEICGLLAEHKVIKPWDLKVDLQENEILLKDFYCIDEERLNSLSATALKELRNKDALTVVYGQLFSMLNVSLLARQVESGNAAVSQNSLSDEYLLSSNDDGSINFDNL